MTRDLRTEPRTPRRMFVGEHWAGHGLESSMQSGSSSRSGRDREQQLEAEANGEQQRKRMPETGPGAAAEADASGEQQLKRTQSGRSSSSESCLAPDYAR